MHSRPGHLRLAEASVFVPVLGEVREMREVAEGADDGDRLLHVEGVEPPGEFHARIGVAVAAKAHCKAANVFDELKELGPLVVAQSLAEDAPEQPDVLAKRDVLVTVDRPRSDALGPNHLGHGPHESGWRVDSTTAVQRSPFVSTCLRKRVASAIGTWTKRPCHLPMSTSVLPAKAA